MAGDTGDTGGTAPGRPPAASHSTGAGGHPVPRHVWVNMTRDPLYRWPGVLVAWRRPTQGRWEALVTYVEGGGSREGHVHTAWVLAEHVTPAQGAGPGTAPP